MRTLASTLVLSLALGTIALADAAPKADAEPDKKDTAAPRGTAGTHTPPGLAKKGGVPPGLAKNFGTVVPSTAYIAVDPRHDDRAWFLIGDKWVLRQGFAPDVRAEVRQVIALPPFADPPPVPLPTMDAPLRVVVFSS